MQVKIVDISHKLGKEREEVINQALAELAAANFEIVDYRSVAGGSGTGHLEMHILYDGAPASLENALAVAQIRDLIASSRPSEKPEEEDYDDTESAYGNGLDVANWEMCERLQAILDGEAVKG